MLAAHLLNNLRAGRGNSWLGQAKRRLGKDVLAGRSTPIWTRYHGRRKGGEEQKSEVERRAGAYHGICPHESCAGEGLES